MKIGLDIDGTITTHPDFFARLSKEHEVVIITSRPEGPKSRADTEQELKELSIEFSFLCMCDWGAEYEINVPEGLEGPARLNYQKVLACKHRGVAALFDDDPIVKALMAEYLPSVPVFTP